ncbi:macrophage mannose receptor 1-like [Acipenser oxyrinchus oxyrinchus]|uniref:Macrophage mannose receptor 1-like n=1 Tax=Acipenser oxyrinchus oxyrinchus TaxID=40147 RepID=A0AAD8CR16_ACIOX|nr:macrophage mannose receptor 1-like [Acipenser oxyrinchus oxyrinchus]
MHSQEEAQQLLNIAGSSLSDSAWIGLYRDDTQNWQWSNSDDVIYSNWRADIFCASVKSKGKWIDSPCHLQRAFMCYQETSNITERYTLIEELKTWTEAQQYCREHHTDLVSIKNASENEDLVKKAQGKTFWIGLFNEPWKWSHLGDNYTFHTWSSGQPDNAGSNEKCVMMSKSGEWYDYGCSDALPFFCCVGGSSGQCFYEETKKTWQEAQSYCRNQDRDLPTIQDQDGVNKLIRLIPKTKENHFWIGLYHDKENWQWSNGDDVIYSNWKADLFCASVNSDGEWEDSVCSEKKAFMCYNETSIITERYTLIEELKTWTEAQQYCREHHTDLVSIKNASENEDLVKKAQGKTFWIGLFNEPWKWSHQGDSYTFHNWNNAEPNNWGGNENCVEMLKSGEWSDCGCNSQYQFFCYDGKNPCSVCALMCVAGGWLTIGSMGNWTVGDKCVEILVRDGQCLSRAEWSDVDCSSKCPFCYDGKDPVSESVRNVDPCSESMRNVDPCSESMRDVDPCSESMRNVDPGSESMRNVDPCSESMRNVDPGSVCVLVQLSVCTPVCEQVLRGPVHLILQ